MRLGGKIFEKVETPEAWVAAHQKLGYRAAYAPPVGPDDDDAMVQAYVDVAAEADLVIAEVGAWSNPISPDDEARRKNIDKCIAQLGLAERLGSVCCVTIIGSRGAQWNGPSPDNLTRETFDLAVATVREIVDAVNPAKTAFTLEMMGWGLPDSAELYLDLIQAVDRPGFAAHVDPVNLVNSPRRYYENAQLIEHTLQTLAPHIRSVHAKDVTLSGKHLVHLDECRPGTGALDFPVLLRELDKLPPDTPLMLEHLPDADEYKAAADYIRLVAKQEGVTL